MTSREIDAVVAEKIMAWYRIQKTTGVFGMPTYYGLTLHDDARGAYEIPRYSSDIGAAFQVVETMRKQGWTFCCSDAFTGSTVVNGPWWVEFTHDIPERSGHATGPTVALAISNAALKAVGVEVEQ